MTKEKISRVESIVINTCSPLLFLLELTVNRNIKYKDIVLEKKIFYRKYIRSLEKGSKIDPHDLLYFNYTPCGVIAKATAQTRRLFK